MDVAAASHIDAAARPAMAAEYGFGAETLQRRGVLLTGDALTDWPWLRGSKNRLTVSGLAGTLVTLDGLRLAPGPDGVVDLSLLPLGLIDSVRMYAGAGGAGQGAGASSGAVDLLWSPVSGGGRLLAAGGQSGRGIGVIDLQLGSEFGWLGGGFTRSSPDQMGGATSQDRWHLAGRFQQDVGSVKLWGRGLVVRRTDGVGRTDWHDAALGVSGGTRWHWRATVGSGGQREAIGASSRLAQARAVVSGATGLKLPGAAEPINVAAGAEWRRLRLGAGTVQAREIFAESAVPILQDKPAAENLVATFGVRQAWLGTGLAGRSETLWQVGGRWEAFPGIALRGQVARGIDDFAALNGTSRSIGLIATPAFVPGLALTVDRRWQSQGGAQGGAQGAARVQAVDVSAAWRGRVSAGTQLALTALATHHDRADFAPLPAPLAPLLPVPRFAGLLRAALETGARGKMWAFTAGVRTRTALAGGLDMSVERQLGEKLRLIVSVSNAGDAGRATGPAGRQALLQVVAGF